VTILRQWLGPAMATALLAGTPAGAAPAACQLLRLAELSVTTLQNKPLVDIAVNGHAARMLVDTGAQRSSLWRPALESLGLHGVGSGERFVGAGGSDDADIVTVRDFSLGGYVVHDLRLYVLGRGTEPGSFVGFLGEDLLSKLDVEFDLPSRAIRLFNPRNCSGDEVVYWAKSYSMMPLVHQIGSGDWPLLRVVLNGREVLALLDSGSGHSTVTSQLVQRPGMAPASAAAATPMQGIAGRPVATSVAVFPTLSIGQEQIQNVRLRVADLFKSSRETHTGSMIPTDPLNAPDMLIGADFFLAHRIYIARSQGKVYFTYQGGPIFQTEVPGPAPAAAQPGAGATQP
jgi:predicted aspartyl protease